MRQAPILTALAVAGLLAACPAHAADHVAVGSPALHCDVKAYENAWTWKVILADGTVRPQGIWTDQVQRTTLAGRDVLRRSQGMNYLTGQHMSLVTLIDPATCAPISAERHGIDGRLFKRSFAGAHITTERAGADGKTVSTVSDLAEPSFDFNDGQ